jgi:hypothetical protein
MDIFIDNKNLKTFYGIECLDYSGALSFAAEREDEREWADKSGVDKNLANIRFDSKEFVLHCVCKAANEGAAYNLVRVLVDYMFAKGCFVLSLRDTPKNIRECYLCQRSNTIVGDINVRYQNSLYAFKIGLKDVNPNALKYKTTVATLSTTVLYTKGQSAVIYWGNGDRGEVSNSGNYSHTYAENGVVDVIVDIDQNAPYVPPLTANFTYTPNQGYSPLEVQFTDTSIGGVVVWAWDFGDGNTSSEQHPLHTYLVDGQYNVSLQVFNIAQGTDTELKIIAVVVFYNSLMYDDFNSIDFGNSTEDENFPITIY